MTRSCRTWSRRRLPKQASAGRRPAPPLPSSWVCTATWTQHVPRCKPRGKPAPSAVPDVLAPGLTCVFCGINPGRVSAAAAAHFANPRNDFWRLLHDAGFTPRLYDPQEQFSLLELGYGVTNAAYRTTAGSGDLRRGDFDAGAFEARLREHAPRAVAFVGKEAYRGLYGERAELGPQRRSIGSTGLFVLPSTSPANAAVLLRRPPARVSRARRVARARRAAGRARAGDRRRAPRAARALRASGDARQLVGGDRRRSRPG